MGSNTDSADCMFRHHTTYTGRGIGVGWDDIEVYVNLYIGEYKDGSKHGQGTNIQTQYLYLLLEDVTKKELGKTTIIIK